MLIPPNWEIAKIIFHGTMKFYSVFVWGELLCRRSSRRVAGQDIALNHQENRKERKVGTKNKGIRSGLRF